MSKPAVVMGILGVLTGIFLATKKSAMTPNIPPPGNGELPPDEGIAHPKIGDFTLVTLNELNIIPGKTGRIFLDGLLEFPLNILELKYYTDVVSFNEILAPWYQPLFHLWLEWSISIRANTKITSNNPVYIGTEEISFNGLPGGYRTVTLDLSSGSLVTPDIYSAVIQCTLKASSGEYEYVIKHLLKNVSIWNVLEYS